MNAKQYTNVIILFFAIISTTAQAATDDYSYLSDASAPAEQDAHSKELSQAYEILDMLRSRSEALSMHGSAQRAIQQGYLPRNLDHIRNHLIKQQLLNVLSATPFSNPQKHVADCKAAIEALQQYTTTIERVVADNAHKQQRAPLSSWYQSPYYDQSYALQAPAETTQSIAPATDEILNKEYDLSGNTPKTPTAEPVKVPAPAMPVMPTATPEAPKPLTPPAPAMPAPAAAPSFPPFPSFPSLPTPPTTTPPVMPEAPKPNTPPMPAMPAMPTLPPIPAATAPKPPVPAAPTFPTPPTFPTFPTPPISTPTPAANPVMPPALPTPTLPAPTMPTTPAPTVAAPAIPGLPTPPAVPAPAATAKK